MNIRLFAGVSVGVAIFLLAGMTGIAYADKPLAAGVRGLATRAPANMKIDGNLEEFDGSFCTPVNYFHSDANALKERAAQFFYMWDGTAFYAALRTLDTKPANHADDAHLWEGDGVEWYFDTRRDDHFRDRTWGPGAVHMYWTGLDKEKLRPRWCLRPDMLTAIKGDGVEVGARRTDFGMEVEFKLPWSNFPNFKATEGEVIALDSELCYSDGGPRVDRTFAYGSPLSVQQPSSQGMVQLVGKLEPAHWKQVAAVMMPIRCDTAWGQETKAHVTGKIALPPNQLDQVGKIIFRVIDLEGKTLGEFPGTVETLNESGKFRIAEARWPSDQAVPGAHLLVGIVYDKSGKELARVAPRLVSVGMQQGY